MVEFVVGILAGIGFITLLILTIIVVSLFCDWVKKVIEDEIRRRVK